MRKFLAGLLGDRDPTETPTEAPAAAPEAVAAGDERLLAARREAQALRLELEERERRLTLLTGELERLRAAEQTRQAEATQASLTRLLSDLAGPVTQVVTQVHLVEAEDRPVRTSDVLAVARRLVRALEDHGLTLDGTVGATAAFDPNRHAPLGEVAGLSPGQPVVVRFVGVAYGGTLLRKAGVQPVEG
jgi:molecular chaperone GrpE (heat shock protein)